MAVEVEVVSDSGGVVVVVGLGVAVCKGWARRRGPGERLLLLVLCGIRGAAVGV